MTDKEARALAISILLPVIFGGGKIGAAFKALLSNAEFVSWLVDEIVEEIKGRD